ncbi:MAG: hypothetical protein IKZ87_08370, partial [Actinomycetaceae bacterium]|nr:hypothetical protein [Actinomycetaceae bacterium]
TDIQQIEAAYKEANMSWWDKYGDYVIAGALIIGGVALTAATFGVGSGALVGAAAYLGTSTSLSLSFAAVSTGVSAMSDKYRTGSVNWWGKAGEFAISFGVGKLGFWGYEAIGVKAAGELGMVSLETKAVQTVEQATVETISKLPVAAQIPVATFTAGGPYLVGEYVASMAEEAIARVPFISENGLSEPHEGSFMEGSTERFQEKLPWSVAEDGAKFGHSHIHVK